KKQALAVIEEHSASLPPADQANLETIRVFLQTGQLPVESSSFGSALRQVLLSRLLKLKPAERSRYEAAWQMQFCTVPASADLIVGLITLKEFEKKMLSFTGGRDYLRTVLSLIERVKTPNRTDMMQDYADLGELYREYVTPKKFNTFVNRALPTGKNHPAILLLQLRHLVSGNLSRGDIIHLRDLRERVRKVMEKAEPDMAELLQQQLALLDKNYPDRTFERLFQFLNRSER
ncbi:MAG: hypothetical protein ACRCZF_19025, partial [Gemmataceae bacterium]